MANDGRPSLVDRFERRFVLSTSRALFLFVAVLAALALFGGGAVFAYSITPTLRGLDPPEPLPPGAPEVTLAEVLAVLDAPAEEGVAGDGGGQTSFVSAELTAGEELASAESRRFAELAAQLAGFFDSTRYPWLSETQPYCTYRSYRGECYNWETRTVRRGVVEILNGALQKLDQQSHIPVLDALVATMPLCEDEDTRFVAVGAVIDLAGVAEGSDPALFGALRTLLEVPVPAAGAKAPATPALLPAAKAQDYMGGLIRARKRGSPTGLLVEWMAAIPSLYELFSVDVEGRSNRVEGLVATWQALTGTIPELASQRLKGIRAIAVAAPEYKRPLVVRTYGDLVRARARQAQGDYEIKLAERERAIATLDSDLAEREAAKAGLRAVASSVVGSAFALIAGVGLLLALLAIERNTRALREVLARLEPAAPSPPSIPNS